MTGTTTGAAMLIEFKTILIGMLDDDEINLVGSGTIDEGKGQTEGIFEIQELPKLVDPRSLGAFLFTGYPNSCQTRDVGMVNPFSGGDYTYTRKYHYLQSGKTTHMDVQCDLSPDGKVLDSVFRVSGSMPRLGSVLGVSAIYEMWAPIAGRIEGSFNVAWLGAKGDNVVEVATTQSTYQPVAGQVPLGSPKHRYLNLESRLDQSGRLHVSQQSNLL